MNRRRNSGYGTSVGKIILIFIAISILAVGAGYGFTKYIITPRFSGSVKDELPKETNPAGEFNGSSIIIDQQTVKSADQDTPDSDTGGTPGTQQQQNPESKASGAVLYSVQYGSFSDKSGAEAASSVLASSSIATVVVEKNGSYKLIGAPFVTKEEARSSLEKHKAIGGNDIFVTAVEVKME